MIKKPTFKPIALEHLHPNTDEDLIFHLEMEDSESSEDLPLTPMPLHYIQTRSRYRSLSADTHPVPLPSVHNNQPPTTILSLLQECHSIHNPVHSYPYPMPDFSNLTILSSPTSSEDNLKFKFEI